MEETFKIMENKRQKKERGEYDNNAKSQTRDYYKKSASK